MFQAILYVLLCASSFSNVCSAGDGVTTDYEFNHTEAVLVQTTKTTRQKWIAEVLDEVRNTFGMHAHVADQCRNDYELYEMFLQNQTIWAIRMMESSEWPRLGLFSGATTSLGDWSECLSVRSPFYSGQYCLVDAVYDYTFAQPDSVTRGWDKPTNQNSSVWGPIKMYDTIITRASRRKLTWALCIPSSCSAEDLQASLINAALPIFLKYDLNFEANVSPASCRVEKPEPVSSAFWFMWGFLLSLGSLVLLATYCDYRTYTQVIREHIETTGKSYAMEAFYAFSVHKSWKSLTHSSPSTIHSLYFAKSFLFWFILCIHEYMLAISFPKLEQEKTEIMYQPWTVIFGFHSAVDVFLAISGFLRFHFGYEPTKKGGISYFCHSITCRWVRLIPVMGLFIAIYVFVFPELGDGPLWSKRMPYEIECCKSNWWANMLAIHNMINRRELCLPNTWYIAVDFQLTMVGAALLVLMAKNFTLGVLSSVVVFAMGVGLHFYSIYTNKFTGLAMPAAYEIEVMRKLPIFSDLYIQMYSRIGPYMIGFIGALLMRELKMRKYRPSIVTTSLLVTVTTFVCVGSQLYGFLFTILNRPYEPIENATYGTLTRLLIAVPAISTIVLLDLRPIGWLSYILEWKVFLAMGRLAFVMYLTSYPIQHFRYSSRRQVPIGSGHVEMAYSIMTNFCLTIIVGGCLFFLAESPLHNLTALIQKAVRRKTTKTPGGGALKNTRHDSASKQDYAKYKTKLIREKVEV